MLHKFLIFDSMAILGTTYVLWIDTITPIDAEHGNPFYYRPIVCGVSNGFNMDVESISVRNKDDGGYDRPRPGYLSSGFDMDGHALGLRYSDQSAKANFHEMALLCRNKVTFWCKMDDMSNPGSLPREVPVWISSYKETANNNEIYTFSCTFVGVGKPFLDNELYVTVLATDDTGIELLEEVKTNLINTKYGN